jgi:GT2 family glycosyltransferase
MKIGIVTVLYRSDAVIDGFLESLNAQGFRDFEVLFVENDVDSPVCEQAIRAKARFGYRFVRNADNVGVARANNQGIDHFLPRADITHLLFVNNDVEFDAGFLSRQVALCEAHAEIEGLAPKMFYHGSGGKVWYAGGRLSYLKNGCRHFGHNKPDRLNGRELYRVDYAPTCSLLVRSEVLRRTGVRMWEQLFVYYDDTIFCWELARHGVRLYYTPTIALQHKISTSTGGSRSDFSRYYLARNWAYTGRKTGNLAVRLLLPLRRAWHALRREDIEIRALRDAARMA